MISILIFYSHLILAVSVCGSTESDPVRCRPMLTVKKQKIRTPASDLPPSSSDETSRGDSGR